MFSGQDPTCGCDRDWREFSVLMIDTHSLPLYLVAHKESNVNYFFFFPSLITSMNVLKKDVSFVHFWSGCHATEVRLPND